MAGRHIGLSIDFTMELTDGFFVNVKTIWRCVNLGQNVPVSKNLCLGPILWVGWMKHQFFEAIWRNRHALNSVGRFCTFNDRRLAERFEHLRGLMAEEILAAFELTQGLDQASHFNGDCLLFKKIAIQRFHELFPSSNVLSSPMSEAK
jgi:hypothetical protein